MTILDAMPWLVVVSVGACASASGRVAGPKSEDRDAPDPVVEVAGAPTSAPFSTTHRQQSARTTPRALRCGDTTCTTEAPFCCLRIGSDGAADQERCVTDVSECPSGSVAYFECHHGDDCAAGQACCVDEDNHRRCQESCGDDGNHACQTAAHCPPTADPRGRPECLVEGAAYAPEDGFCVTRPTLPPKVLQDLVDTAPEGNVLEDVKP
jgi:hypothetical protein